MIFCRWSCVLFTRKTSWMRYRYIIRCLFRHDVFDESVKQFSSILNRNFLIRGKLSKLVVAEKGSNLAQCIEYLIKVQEYLPFGDLCNVIHRFQSIIA